MRLWLALAVVTTALLAWAASCTTGRPAPAHRTLTEPVPEPAVRPVPAAKPKHGSHDHPHGAHPHKRDAHHHHPHLHPHVEAADGHHHPH